MTTGMKWALGISGVTLVVGAYFAIDAYTKYQKNSGNKTDNPEQDKKDADAALAAATKNLIDTVSSNETTTKTKLPSDKLPFKIDKGNGLGGSQGLYVGQLQMVINYVYGTSLAVDGKFGQATKKALADNLPFGMYNCNSAAQLLDKNVCDVTQTIWVYLMTAAAKKAGVAAFQSYITNNAQFKALGQKYKV